MGLGEVRDRLLDPDDETTAVGLWAVSAIVAIAGAIFVFAISTVLPRPGIDPVVTASIPEHPAIESPAPVPHEAFEELDTYRLETASLTKVVAAVRSENTALAERLERMETILADLRRQLDIERERAKAAKAAAERAGALALPPPLGAQPLQRPAYAQPPEPIAAQPAEGTPATIAEAQPAPVPDLPPVSLAPDRPMPTGPVRITPRRVAASIPEAVDSDQTGSIFARSRRVGVPVPIVASPPQAAEPVVAAVAAPESPMPPSESQRVVPITVDGEDALAPLPRRHPKRVARSEQPRVAARKVVSTRWGIDLGSAPDEEGLKPAWRAFSELAPPLAAVLRPMTASNGETERLVVGPFTSEVDAGRACAVVSAGGQACRPVPYEGRPVDFN